MSIGKGKLSGPTTYDVATAATPDRPGRTGARWRGPVAVAVLVIGTLSLYAGIAVALHRLFDA